MQDGYPICLRMSKRRGVQQWQKNFSKCTQKIEKKAFDDIVSGDVTWAYGMSLFYPFSANWHFTL